jgi:hypothetical protein
MRKMGNADGKARAEDIPRRAQYGAGTYRRRIELWTDRLGGRSEPTLERDGELLLRWTVEGVSISAAEPPIFAGHTLTGAGFHLLAERELDAELAEAALVFRRAIFIGLGRQYDFERIDRAKIFALVVGSACHTFGPDQVEAATRVYGSVRDFTTGHDASAGRDAMGRARREAD